jgi:predicted enzyme related to lactoylglutathione lyase
MWWGTAIEAPDSLALATFYSGLLGWPISHQEPGTAILAAPEGSIYVVFQESRDYRAPVWPPVDAGQRTMMHFDFQVGDLDSAVAEAVALGASVASHQPSVLLVSGRRLTAKFTTRRRFGTGADTRIRTLVVRGEMADLPVRRESGAGIP